MKVLCVGEYAYEIKYISNGEIKENNKYILSEKNENITGLGGISSYLLASWGMETYSCGIVGSDEYGQKLKKQLEGLGVKNDYLETSFDKATALHFTAVNKQNGEKIVFSTAGYAPKIKKGDVAISMDFLLVDPAEFNASLSILDRYQTTSKLVVLDEYNAETNELCKLANYAVMSKEFAESATSQKINPDDSASLANIYNAINNKYPRTYSIITLGANGALYKDNNEIKIVQGITAKATDLTNAKNIFASALTYCLASNYDINRSITIANIAAGLFISKENTAEFIPSLNEVMTYYTSKTGKAITEEKKVEAAPVIQTQTKVAENPAPAINNPATQEVPNQSPALENTNVTNTLDSAPTNNQIESL